MHSFASLCVVVVVVVCSPFLSPWHAPNQDGVGKSRFIRTCLAESVVEDDASLKRVLPHINLVKKSEVTTVFMDTAGTPQSPEEKAQFEADVRAADVILLLYHAQPVPYDETRPRDEVAQLIRKKLRHWLQRVRILRGDENNFPPVILVGTHIDVRSSMMPGEHADAATLARFYEQIENVNYAEEMQPIFSEYPEVDGGYEVSCSLLLNIRAALLNAHRAVVYPTKPIYDSEKKRLTPQYLACLKRIFALCDLDCDGVLNDTDISYFNKKTFDMDLPSKDLEHVKRIAAYSNAGFVDMDRGGAVRFEGFCFWLTVFAEKHEDEVPWQVAYAWGYDRKLRLRPEYLCPRDLYFDGLLETDLVGPAAVTLELSNDAIKWLAQLFSRHAHGRTHLTVEQLELMWSSLAHEGQALEVPIPWSAAEVAQGEVVQIEAGKGLTLQSFLALWSLLLADNTFAALEKTVSCASLLGYTHLDEAEENDASFVQTPVRWDDDRRYLRAMIVSSNPQILAGIASKLTGVPRAGVRSCGYLDEGILLNVECPREPVLTLSVVSRTDCFVFAYGDEPGGWEFCHAFAQTIRNAAALRECAPVMFLHVPTSAPGGNDKSAENGNLASSPASSSSSTSKSAAIAYCRSLGVPPPITMDGIKSWDEFRGNFMSCVVEKRFKKWIIQPGPSTATILTGVALVGLLVAGWFLWQRSKKDAQ